MLARIARWAAFVSVCSMPQVAAADTVFTSFGPGNAVDGSTPFPLSGGQAVAQAVAFVPSAGYSVTQVEAALRATGGAGSSTLFVTIVPDVAGSPGAAAVWTSDEQTVAGGMTPIVVTFVAPGPGTLTAGQRYWVVIQGSFSIGNAAVAHAGLPNAMGTRASRSGTSSWTITPDTVVPAIRVSGELGGACCNPVTGGCAVLTPSTCAALGLDFAASTTCSPGLCAACPADINRSGSLSVQDIFDFLEAYFSGCP